MAHNRLRRDLADAIHALEYAIDVVDLQRLLTRSLTALGGPVQDSHSPQGDGDSRPLNPDATSTGDPVPRFDTNRDPGDESDSNPLSLGGVS